MPSPTERTCPTSETSASWPKFLIWSFRMAVISAARISISACLFHRVLDRIEFGAERTVDHAGTELDGQPADDRRIDPDVEIDRLFAGDRLERGLELLEPRVGKLFGDRDLGGHL